MQNAKPEKRQVKPEIKKVTPAHTNAGVIHYEYKLLTKLALPLKSELITKCDCKNAILTFVIAFLINISHTDIVANTKHKVIPFIRSTYRNREVEALASILNVNITFFSITVIPFVLSAYKEARLNTNAQRKTFPNIEIGKNRNVYIIQQILVSVVSLRPFSSLHRVKNTC